MDSVPCPFCSASGRKEASTAHHRTIRYIFECGTFGLQLDYESSKPKFQMSGECARRVSSKTQATTQEEVNAK